MCTPIYKTFQAATKTMRKENLQSKQEQQDIESR